VLITSTLFQIVDNPKGVVGEGKDVQSLPEALDDEPLLGMLHRSYREFKVRDLSRRRVLLPRLNILFYSYFRVDSTTSLA